MPDRPMVDLEQVSCSYVEGERRHDILRGISASVRAGETVALLGRSGSGKSTLLNVISGLAAPSSGRIWVDGEEVTGRDERARTLLRRRAIGVIYQFFNLIDTLSVADNVLLPLELAGRLDDGARSRVLGLLDEVGLGERREAFPDRLSGGEQQRVALVRALAHAPPLVLADEPTGNLDAETGEQVLTLLDRLVRDRGHTLILVTHSLEIAARADRVLHLED
ncbi:MAG: ABC transporter ATP-binding protein, partial [Halofilum sp. (in: g-proteobacteria)]